MTKIIKTSRINLRLSADELDRLRELSKDYSSLSAFILDACNVPFGYQVGAFIVVSIALLVTVGKWARKLLKGRVETNVDALVGQEIIILKDTSYRDVGEAKINGVIWSTVCVEDETIKEGSIAIIQEIKGNKLYIKSK